MARRTSGVAGIIEILVHWHAGRNTTEIAASLNVDRKTVRKYAAVAQSQRRMITSRNRQGRPGNEWSSMSRDPHIDMRLRCQSMAGI